MTPQELELLRANSRVVAEQTMSDWLASLLLTFLQRGGPEALQHSLKAVEAKLAAGQQEYASITFGECDPATSDLRAAEFQEAFAAAVARIKRTLGIAT